MALGDYNFFQFKSKEQTDREAEEYAAWAFPYGEKQREILASRLKELKVKDSENLMLISFLTCKELYEKALKETQSEEDVLRNLIAKAGVYKQIVRSKDLSMYIAMVIADAAIDENCEYPTADELRERIREIDKFRTGK